MSDSITNDRSLALTRDTRLTYPPAVLFSRIDEEVVVLCESTGTYFGINEVGGFIFERVGRGSALGEIHSAILETFDSDEVTAWDDLTAFVRRMLDLGLLSVVPAS